MGKPHIIQIMAECDCNDLNCYMRGYCMADRIEALEAECDALRKRIEAADQLADRVEKAESGWPHKPGWVSEALAAYRATEGQT